MNKLKSVPSIVIFTVTLSIASLPLLANGIASEGSKLYQHIQQYQEYQKNERLPIDKV